MITRVWSGVFSDIGDPNTEETIVIETEVGPALHLNLERAGKLVNDLLTIINRINLRREAVKQKRVQKVLDIINSDPELKRLVLMVLKGNDQ